MACGKAVVASRIPGPEEIVVPAKTGFLFAVGDHNELADYSRLLAQDPQLRGNLGQAGRALVRQRYTYDAVATYLAEVYSQLLAGRPGTIAR
jgi:glycosyltransferase involved in cell wall biosynthesis